MFNVNFYGRMAAAEREGEISATKSGFITKAAGHCRFMTGRDGATARVRPPYVRPGPRPSVALRFIIPLSRFNLRTLSQQRPRRRRGPT